MDIVLSHTVPIEAEPVWAFIPGLDQSAVDKSTEKWLQKIYDRLDFTEWYAGHYHVESEEYELCMKIMMKFVLKSKRKI